MVECAAVLDSPMYLTYEPSKRKEIATEAYSRSICAFPSLLLPPNPKVQTSADVLV